VKYVDQNRNIKTKHCEDIEVGEAVILQDNEMIPADIILLATQDPNGKAYI